MAIPGAFVLLFTWIGLVILLGKVDIDISAERVLLGIAALMIGGLWAWLSMKGKMPFGYATPKLTTAQTPVQKLMRRLFLLAGMAAYVVLAIMPEMRVYTFFRVLSFWPILDTLGLLALFFMVMVFVMDSLITTVKYKLMPHKKNKRENSLYQLVSVCHDQLGSAGDHDCWAFIDGLWILGPYFYGLKIRLN